MGWFSLLVELAPQYYLGNLPPSDGLDLLMSLRLSLFPPGDPDSTPQEKRLEDASDESSADTCSVQ
ncbi:hypothetical protein F2P79_007627 [Pimephales promelas]|nr:hypothetical protein F2P79_007627 [Pimephales promelas]